MTRRPDSLPAKAERAVLEAIGGVEPPAATPAPNYELAYRVRALNARLATVTPEAQASLMDDWHADWEALTVDREAAADNAAELAAIDKWARSWTRRLQAAR